MLDKFSSTEKLFLAAGLGVGGYLLYSYFFPSKALASSESAFRKDSPYPLPSPSALPKSSPSASPLAAAAPAASAPAFTTRRQGPTYYDVVTKTDPLTVRSGPGASYPVLGTFQKGAIATSTGMLTDVGGVTYAELVTPDNKVGWSNAAYLKPHNPSGSADASIASTLQSGVEGLTALWGAI